MSNITINSKFTGQTFGRLQILRVHKKFTSYYAETQCQCGIFKTILLTNITQGRSKSCGCLNLENIKGPKPERRLKKGEASFNALYRKYEYKARKRNLEFSLTKLEFKKLTSSVCHYCDQIPSNSSSRSTYYGAYIYNGIDRVDNSRGYILENCVSCCQRCNLAKGTLNYYDFIQMCMDVAQNLKKGTNK